MEGSTLRAWKISKPFRRQSLALESFALAHLPREGSCAFCWQTFRVFRRSIICNDCPRNVCSQCQVEGLCKYCHEIKALNYKRIELRVLCPYGKEAFGYCKMLISERQAVVISEWRLRATIELHLTHLLEVGK